MRPMGISINRLARDIVVPPGRISAIVNGKSAITADTAIRLGRYFGTSPEVWMGLQADYELRVAQRTIGPEVEKRVPARRNRAITVCNRNGRLTNIKYHTLLKVS